MAAISPEIIIGRMMPVPLVAAITIDVSTVFCTVSATPKPIRYLATKKAIKLKAAAHRTACIGVRTFVETTVAILLAAS